MSTRVPGAISAASNFEMLVRKPFDARQVVPSFAALTSAANWTNASDAKTNPGKINAYNGLIVAVTDTSDLDHNGIYYLFDPECTSSIKSPDVTNSDNWHKVANLSEVTSNSGSIDETAVNSLIDARIDALKAEIAKAGYLTEANLEGYATETFVTNKIAEAQLAGEEVDLSGYATKDDLNDYAKTADIEANYATKNDVDASKIINISSRYELPNVGEVGYFYINETDGKTYIWDVENSKMVNFGIHSVKVIDGGDANSVYGA